MYLLETHRIGGQQGPAAPAPSGKLKATQAAMPLWRSRASTWGSRPRKARNSSIGSFEPPFSRMCFRKDWPVTGLKIPSSSKREKASAESTSAHL